MPESSESTRLDVDLNPGWLFCRRRVGRGWIGARLADDGAVAVDLPHSWNEQDTFQQGVEYERGHGTYRRCFALPDGAGDRVWFLEAGGFYGTGDVWINGRKAADVDGQYLGFRLPVDDFLSREGENILGIRLTNRHRAGVLPGIRTPDFLLYGGLAGGVRLRGVPRLHLDEAGAEVRSEIGKDGRAAVVRLAFCVRNRSERARSVTVRWQVLDAAGVEAGRVETPIEAPATGEVEGSVTLVLDEPRLWSLDNPHRYRAVVRAEDPDGRLLDSLELPFGLRNAEFRPGQGFFLNGERVALRGVNRHESLPGFGSALPPAMHRQDAAAIKAMGLNFVRLSHYPQHPAFLDACDELGLLVYAELASWKSVRTGRWLRSALRQLGEMIRRDRRHPSVILWGLGNEARSRPAYLALRHVARRADPTRPVIYAENHWYRAKREGTLGVPDVWGLNYEWDAVESGCAASRLRNVVVSECANAPHAVRGEREGELSQVRAILDSVSRAAASPCIAGFALWSFSDYATLRKERFCRHCGVVDAWRAPKMSAALLRALFAREPVLEVFGDWGAGGRGVRSFDVFTNCEQVSVRAGDRAALTIEGQPHATVDLEFRQAELRFEGRGPFGAVTARIEPWGAPRRVEVVPTTARAAAGARETVALEVRVVDEAGRVARTWSGEAFASAAGPARLRAYRQDGGLLVARGLGRTFVTGAGAPGVASIRVSAGPLQPGEAVIRFE